MPRRFSHRSPTAGSAVGYVVSSLTGVRVCRGRLGLLGLGRGGGGGVAGLEQVEHGFGGMRQRFAAAADRRRKVAEGFFDFVTRQKLILLVTFAARASRPEIVRTRFPGGRRRDAPLRMTAARMFARL